MKLKPFSKTVTLAITSALLLTACSGNNEDAAGSGDNQSTVDTAAENMINLNTLDTGDFPTEPRSEKFTTTAENIHLIESQRLAEYTVLPFEIDPTLTITKYSQVPVIGPGLYGGINKLLGDGPEYLPDELDKILYGYSSRARRTETSSDPRVEVAVASLRFENNAAAKAAAEALNRYWIAPDDYFVRTPRKIDALPHSLATVSLPDIGDPDPSSIESVTVHNDFIIYTWAQNAPEEMDWTTTATVKLVTEQTKLLDKFPAADLDDPTTWPKMDQNNILKYTLGFNTDDASFHNGIYGPRGSAHTAPHPQITYEVLTEAGSDHNAVAGTEVSRAKDNNGAIRIHEELMGAIHDIDGYTEESIPKGLEDTQTLCLSHPLKAGTFCSTVVGRYVGQWALPDKTEAHQQISAQYAVLQHADQNAN